jgi:hypothetical protein
MFVDDILYRQSPPVLRILGGWVGSLSEHQDISHPRFHRGLASVLSPTGEQCQETVPDQTCCPARAVIVQEAEAAIVVRGPYAAA